MRTTEKREIGHKQVMPFTIPSGIVTTEVSCLERIALEIPELGILTTKSIGTTSRPGNREPILAQYLPGGFINAVGLTNPGAEEFARRLSAITIPQDKFLLVSIFGKDADEFVSVARALEPFADGFELNLSCPHAKGYGMQLGQDPAVVADIVKHVVEATPRLVFAKLTPNASDIGSIAKSAVAAGAYGIAAINTVGPGYHSADGQPVLTNKVGGLSGIGILPLGLKCVRDIRQAVGESVPIIGMGGIATARDVNEYAAAGADFFGIGSALAGLTDRELIDYFAGMATDLRSDCRTDCAGKVLRYVDMEYRRLTIAKKVDHSSDFSVITVDEHFPSEPGQFVFTWLPGIGEKPFSVMDDDPLTLGVLRRGAFTQAFNALREGDAFYMRGPYGQKTDVPEGSTVVLAGGGSGVAGVYLLAKRLSEKATVHSLLAARDGQHILYADEFRRFGKVDIATEDGSLGRKGLITDLLRSASIPQGSYFFNCGPKPMIAAIVPLESQVSAPERIFSSVDYMTRCGVGICGSCADGKGRRTCVEGPFMDQLP